MKNSLGNLLALIRPHVNYLFKSCLWLVVSLCFILPILSHSKQVKVIKKPEIQSDKIKRLKASQKEKSDLHIYLQRSSNMGRHNWCIAGDGYTKEKAKKRTDEFKSHLSKDMEAVGPACGNSISERITAAQIKQCFWRDPLGLKDDSTLPPVCIADKKLNCGAIYQYFLLKKKVKYCNHDFNIEWMEENFKHLYWGGIMSSPKEGWLYQQHILTSQLYKYIVPGFSKNILPQFNKVFYYHGGCNFPLNCSNIFNKFPREQDLRNLRNTVPIQCKKLQSMFCEKFGLTSTFYSGYKQVCKARDKKSLNSYFCSNYYTQEEIETKRKKVVKIIQLWKWIINEKKQWYHGQGGRPNHKFNVWKPIKNFRYFITNSCFLTIINTIVNRLPIP